VPQEKGGLGGGGDPIGLNGVFFNRDVFDLCVKN